MESIRQSKVSRLLQKEIATILQSKDIITNHAMVSVTVVRVTSDLSFAKVYLSVFPPDKREETLDLIKLQASEVRKRLGNSVRHQLRKIPELAYYIDDSYDFALKIEDLLKK